MLTCSRCFRRKAWVCARTRCLIDQASDPELVKHGRRLVLLELPPLAPDSDRAPQGYELDWRQEGLRRQSGGRGEACEGGGSGTLGVDFDRNLYNIGYKRSWVHDRAESQMRQKIRRIQLVCNGQSVRRSRSRLRSVALLQVMMSDTSLYSVDFPFAALSFFLC